MSRYPYVIFFRHKKYSDIDNFIENNKLDLMCSIHITDDTTELFKLFNPNYHLLVTYGETYNEYHYISSLIPPRFSSRWFHKQDISNTNEFNHNVNYCYIHNVIQPRETTRPSFSIFTTCFKSYDYIVTAYESIKKQTLLDWEWVIIDDTDEYKHFDFLRSVLSQDNRVRLYKRDKNSGNIGNVKNEVISLCRGKYILEMDHDDELLCDCLLDAYNLFQSDDNIGFVYGDTIHLYRDGRNFSYGDFICKGYGGYYMEKVNGKWVYVYTTPNINNITLSHLVCLPNHPRIWKRSVLMELGSYSEFLPICDDYEILLRTCCDKYKVVKNNKAQYIQYMNDGGNNFSNIRNAEINRIGPNYISPMFYTKYAVHDKMKQLEAYEDEKYITHHSPIWKRGPEYEHKKMNQRMNLNYDKQYCIINESIHNVELLPQLYEDRRNDFLFLSNQLTHQELQNALDKYGFHRMKCYSLMDCSVEELIRYFKMVYLNDNCEYEVINETVGNINNISNNINNSKYSIIDDNTKLQTRHDVLNHIITEQLYTSYLEIGVETGATFKQINIENKLGVDPDPSYKTRDIVMKTSDDFFKETNDKFDIIFVDGMHQLEYVYNDFFNSINCLTTTGSVVVDDVLPMNEREQYKVPIKHYYHNGILKYGEPWTGDVWKFIYFLFLHYHFDFSIYNFTNGYRGMIHIYNFKNTIKQSNGQNLNKTNVIEIMNTYDYNTHYGSYIDYIKGNTITYKYKLSIGVCIKNESFYINEFIQHYISQGVEHFYIIDNNSDDDIENVLKSSNYNSLITLITDKRIIDMNDAYSYPNGLISVINDNLYEIIKKETEWAIIVDIDEFMYGKNGYNIKSYLENVTSDIGCIYVLWNIMTISNINNEISTSFSIYSNRFKRLNYDTINNLSWNIRNANDFGKSIFRTSMLNGKIGLHKTHSITGKIINNYGENNNSWYDNCNAIDYSETKFKHINITLDHYVIRHLDDYNKKKISYESNNKQRNSLLTGVFELFDIDDVYFVYNK